MTLPTRTDSAIRLVPSRLSLLTALLLAGCGLHAGDSKHPATTSKTRAVAQSPARWVGRWWGKRPRMLQILPRSDGQYALKLRNATGRRHRFLATAVDDRLLFRRNGRTLAIQPGATNDDPPKGRSGPCLVIRPGGAAYCRTPDTADALPLARGAYVSVRTPCRAATRAQTLFFNGRALLRPGQQGCHASVMNQHGIVFRLHDSCASGGPIGGTNRSANETADVPGSHRLSLTTADGKTRLYRYCAVGLLPAAVRSKQPRAGGKRAVANTDAP